ncbi:MAG: YhcH/YjgK/YiaL family protein [Alphaproteobacteria bacterium]|nr:YhcH/YjgK/YiaL family protein [Alphaproteobacteria bacterium]
MIFDSLSNIETYKGLYANLDEAIDFIRKNGLQTLKKGKNVIRGEDIFANFVDGKLIDETEGVYELHQHYLDLHIDIEGTEKILFADYVKSNETQAYSEDGDYALLTGNATAECLLDKNHFAICMIGEPHKPCVRNSEAGAVSKVIFKIKVAQG